MSLLPAGKFSVRKGDPGKFSVRKGDCKADSLVAFSQDHGGIPRGPEDASLSPQRERAGHSAP